MKKNGGKIVTTVLAMAIFSAIIIYVYARLVNPSTTTKLKSNESEVQILMNKDLNGNYPKTPREVMKMYARITKCIYSTEMSANEFSALADQLRLLFDTELLADNPRDMHLAKVKAEVEDYIDKNKTIMSCKIESSNDIEYQKISGEDCARVYIMFMTKEGSKYSKNYEEFILREDNAGDWKILGWQKANEPAVDMEE